MFVQLSVTGQDGFDTPGVLEVVTMHAISSLVTSDAVAAIQAQSSGAPSSTLQVHQPVAPGSTTSSIAMVSAESVDEQMRVKLLSDPSAHQAIKDGYQHNVTEGAMMLMAHFITHQTTMFVYGGYIRDFVIYGRLATNDRGDIESDIDIGIGQESPQSGLEKLAQFAKEHQIKLNRRQAKGPRVLEAFFQPAGGKEFPIELVDSGTPSSPVRFLECMQTRLTLGAMCLWRAAHFAKSDGKIDFDVNNLKLQPTVSGQPLITHKFANQGGPVSQICHNARHRQMCVMKPTDQISDRIQKMKNQR
jgi:hypothetical protein